MDNQKLKELFPKTSCVPFPTIMDGATRTRLIENGLAEDGCAEQFVLENPKVFQEIQRNYVRSGANIVTAATFGCNRHQLNKFGLGSNTPDYIRKLVGITIGVGMSWHCGSVGPTGKEFNHSETVKSFEEIYKIYSEQVSEMDKVTVNYFALENGCDLAEVRACVSAIRDFSKTPIFVCFEMDKDGKTVSGDELIPAIIALSDMGINAIGCSCKLGPYEMAEVLRPAAKFAITSGMSLVALPDAKTADKTYTDEDFYNAAKEMLKFGTLVIGGCCGTDDSHIKAIRKAVDEGIEIDEAVLTDLPDLSEYAATNSKYAKIDLSNPEILKADEGLFGLDREFAIVEVNTTEESDFILNNQDKITTPLAVKGSIKAIKYLKKYYNGKVFDASRALRH